MDNIPGIYSSVISGSTFNARSEIKNEIAALSSSLDEKLNEKVKSTNIKEIRENANTFEYSLDGTTFKQVQSGGGSSAPNVKYLDSYLSLTSGDTNWIPAFNQAFADLGANGGVVQLGAKQYLIRSTLTIPTNVNVVGLGQGVSIIKLANGIDADIVTLDTNDNCGISNLSIKGNVWESTPSNNKDGLVLGRAGLNLVNGNMPNLTIHDIEIRDVSGNGFRCYLNTWVYYISRMTIAFCSGYGAYIQSTDNVYNSWYVQNNGKAGLYITGSNNRFTDMKIIFNGRGNDTGGGVFLGNGNDIDSAGVYCASSTRNTFVNVECQENYGHGWVFDGAKDVDLAGCLSDKNGYSKLAASGGSSMSGSATAAGFYFMNSALRISGMVKATNFNQSLVSQLYGYYIDSTCVNVSLDYEQDATQGTNTNLSPTSIVSTADKKAKVFANGQYNDFLQSGLSLTNKITAYDTNVFQFATNMMTAGYTISTANNEITGQTAWAQTSPRMGTKSTLTTTVNRIYLVRVKVKPVIDNYTLKLTAYWDEAPYNTASTAGTVTGTYKSGVYTDVSFVFKAGRTSSALGVWIEDKTLNVTQGTFTAAEFAVIDITDVIPNYLAKTLDTVVSKNYFLNSRTFGAVGIPFELESGTTAQRPVNPRVGRVYLDTTLGKPVYCTTGGATPVWKDAMGTTV